MEERKDEHLFLHSLIDINSLYENAPCGYVSFSAAGKVFKANATLLSWLGYSSAELVDVLSFTDLISRGGKIYYEMFYFPLLQLQSAVNEISFDFVRRDGSRFPALVNSKVVRSGNGELLVVNATIFDITDRRKYEHELLLAKDAAESERSRFEVLSDFLPEMIWTAGPDGRPSYFNKRFLNFFSIVSAGDVQLSAIMARVFERDRHVLLGSWMRALRSGEDFQAQVRLVDDAGDPQWYLIRAVGLRESGGRVSKWMGSCTNINQHVTAIEKLDEFISIASHELHTPVTTLKASLQLMERFKDQLSGFKGLPRLIEQSSRSAEKIGSLVSELLNAGNITDGQMSLDKTEVDLAELLRGTCTHVVGSDANYLSVECPSGLTVFADGLRLDQVLVNFVNNAIKYAPGSGEILLSAERMDCSVKVSVRDNGPGIPPDKLPRIFERYYRIEKSGAGYSGLGLGLYICSEIIRRHGGQIGVDSVVGKGTTFWFTLPV